MAFYTYVYSEPVTNKPIYIGKGKGNRYISHFYNKESVIYQYLQDNPDTVVTIVAENQTEEQALAVEAYLIEQHKETVFNRKGNYRYYKIGCGHRISNISIKEKKEMALQLVIVKIQLTNTSWTKENILEELETNYKNIHHGIIPAGHLLPWGSVIAVLELNNIYQVSLRSHNVSGVRYTYVNGGI